jgi:hypothetical protein
MTYLLKKSHFFSSAVFLGAAGWLTGMQVTSAALGAANWSDLPAMLALSNLSCGLLAIAVNFVWLYLRGAEGVHSEEPRDYFPSHRVLGAIVLTVLAALALGSVQGVTSAHALKWL